MRALYARLVILVAVLALTANTSWAASKLPSVQAISPAIAAARSGSFTLTVSGSTFNPSDTVTWTDTATWNSTKLATTLQGSTKATAVVPATAVATAGTAQVAMWDSKTGKLSNYITFTISAASVSVSTTPSSTSIAPGKSQQFTATVTGTTNTAVMWSATAGTVSSAGLYTAPNTAGTYSVKATSVADTTQAANATVTVSATTSIAVSISPSTASVTTGGTQQFTAAVSGTTNTAVSWSATGGTISSAGFYTAPTTAGTYTVTATSTADTTKSASAVVTVTAPTTSSTNSYSTNFPATENPISEGGQWINGLTDGLDWSNCRTTTNFAYGTQNYQGNDNDSSCTVKGSWGPVQTVSATVVNNCGSTCQGSTPEFELLVHFTVAAHVASGYEVTFSAANNGYCGLARWNGALNNYTSITNNGAGGIVALNHNLVTGDIVKATIDSTGLITAYINNNPIPGCSARDTTFPTGNPGMGFYHVSSGNGLDSQWGYSSFTANDSGSTTATATPVSVAVTPNNTSVTTNGTVQFSAAVTGATNTAVTWSVTSGGGTITSTGLYTAPSSAGTATVVATSVAAATASALAYVAINAPTTAVLSASPTSVSFGSVLVGGSTSQVVKLTNTGNSSVAVSSASLTGTGFNLSGLSFPFTLAAGASQSANVSFAPSSSGTASGSVSFVSNATNSPATVALSGSGTATVQHTATLNWQPGGPSPAGYNVYRSTASGGSYTRLNSVLNLTASYSDSTVFSGQTYYYVVTEVSSSGMESGYSSQVTAVVPTP